MLYFSRWKSALIWLAVLVSLIIASPNFFSRETLANLPDFLPKKQVSLGLDLSGGSRLILQVQNAGKTDLETTANIMRQRLEELGYGNPVVEGEGRNQNSRGGSGPLRCAASQRYSHHSRKSFLPRHGRHHVAG